MVARASFQSSTPNQLFLEETVSQFRSLLEMLTGKAYHHLPAEAREPIIGSFIESGLLDVTLSEHFLTEDRQTLSEPERIQFLGCINSTRPRIPRNNTISALISDTQRSEKPHSPTLKKTPSWHPPSRAMSTPAMKTRPSFPPRRQRAVPLADRALQRALRPAAPGWPAGLKSGSPSPSHAVK